MCTVSAVTGALQNYPWQRPMDAATWNDIQRILRLCEKIDRKLGEPDCVDPEKDAWRRKMEKRIAKLEAAD